MKIPEKAPGWQSVLSANFTALFEPENMAALNELILRIDHGDSYVYWDVFKYHPMPKNITQEQAWAYLKFSRQSKILKTELVSKESENFGYWAPDNVLRKISFIDQHASGQILIGDATIHRAEQKRYLINSLMEEAIASSQLEGAATTRKVAKEMLRSGRKPKSHAERMIYNNYQTIIKIKELIKKPLSNELLYELHRSMTEGTLEPSLCGRFRTAEDDPIDIKDAEGNVLYEPPSPDKISAMMKILYDYANEVTIEERFTHPVIKAVNLHFYLSYVHPFNDGNRRSARALFYWYMLKKGYWMFEYLTISKIFLEAPSQYAKAFLYTEIDNLDLTYFITFHLRVIDIAINKLIHYIKRKQKEVSETTRLLKKYSDLNHRQGEALRYILDHPDGIYGIGIHQNIHSITYETSRTDLLNLVMKKLIIMKKKGRRFCFLASKNLTKEIKRL
jgi:Fic family protein